MTINFDDLFAQCGQFFSTGNALNTALGTTVPGKVDDSLQGLDDTLPTKYEDVRRGVRDGLASLTGAGTSANSALVQSPVQQLILLWMQDDKPLVGTLDAAIRELIKQMSDNSESLDASTVSAAVAYDAGNTGSGTVVTSVKRADGKVCLLALAEAIRLTCGDVADDGTASFDGVAPASVSPLDPTWPQGSGASFALTSKTASAGDNLAPNGTFEDNDTNSVHLPGGWIASVATLGTTLKMSSVEVQTVAISGTPTGGFYTLTFTDNSSRAMTTIPLAFDAGEADVQTALRALPGLGAITVVSSGTTPDYTHTITFTGVTNPAQLTSTSSLTGGSPAIAHATTTAGSAHVMRGARSVEFASNGAQLTTIQVPVTLAELTQYACNLFLKASTSSPAAGVITVDLVNGIGGSVLADEAGTNNSFMIANTSMTTSFQAFNGVFRTPSILPPQVYLRIRISTAVTNTVSVYLDEVFLGEMTEMYVDGPSVIVFDGATAWDEGDIATVTVSQNRAGAIHEWLDRVLSLRENRLIFPTVTDGSETQDDSLIP